MATAKKAMKKRLKGNFRIESIAHWQSTRAKIAQDPGHKPYTRVKGGHRQTGRAQTCGLKDKPGSIGSN